MNKIVANYIVLIIISFVFFACENSMEFDQDSFIGEWKLTEIAMVDSLGNKKTVKLPNQENIISALEDKTFSAVLTFFGYDNPNIYGTWDRTDKEVVSLMLEIDETEKKDALLLHQNNDNCIINFKTLYKKDSVNYFKFSKQ